MGILSKLFSPNLAAPPKELTKTNIKDLFTAIRNGEMKTVKQLISSNPGFVNACAAAPPKKDDGQSPLQVSLKTGQFAIADYLIEHGGDVNFMEETKINEWRTPVLHDAIRAAVFSAEIGRFDLAIGVLRKLIARGANPNAADSYGNNCLMRAILDARQRIRPGFEAQASAQLQVEVGEVFKTLIKAGADVNAKGPERPSAVEETRGTILERFVC